MHNNVELPNSATAATTITAPFPNIVNSKDKERNTEWFVRAIVDSYDNDYEEDKNVRVFSKSTKDIIDGFVVMVVSPEKDGGEAIFVNIVGSIDPSQIAMITDNLDINFN